MHKHLKTSGLGAALKIRPATTDKTLAGWLGKTVRFKRSLIRDPGFIERHGSIVRDSAFVIREVQVDYKGRPCLRGYATDYDDTFGRIVDHNMVEEYDPDKTVPEVHESIARCKNEILQDMRAGKVPMRVSSFGELHDYTDANCYGGFCVESLADAMIDHYGGRDSDEGIPQGMLNHMNETQDAVSRWLNRGGHIAQIFPDLQFDVYGTGGGCEALMAVLDTADGSYQCAITDDDAGVPDSPDAQVWLGVYNDKDDEAWGSGDSRYESAFKNLYLAVKAAKCATTMIAWIDWQKTQKPGSAGWIRADRYVSAMISHLTLLEHGVSIAIDLDSEGEVKIDY